MSNKEIVVCKIGDYAPVDSNLMATVIFDNKKIAECYTNEDAEFVGKAIKFYQHFGGLNAD